MHKHHKGGLISWKHKVVYTHDLITNKYIIKDLTLKIGVSRQ